MEPTPGSMPIEPYDQQSHTAKRGLATKKVATFLTCNEKNAEKMNSRRLL